MNVLVIPSAKLIDPDLRNIYGNIPPLLLPFRGKRVFDIIYNELNHLYDKIIIIVGEEGDLIYEHQKVKSYKKIAFINAKKITNLTETISNIFSSDLLSSRVTNLSILFGDTFFNKEEISVTFGRNMMFIGKVNDSKRWTIINKDKLYDKEHHDFSDNLKAVTGFFNFTSYNQFKHGIESSNSFYDYIQKMIDNKNLEIYEGKTWVDLGHKDNFDFTKKNESRYFNKIDINYDKNILQKTTTKNKKLISEIMWYLNLPNSVKYVSPTIYEYSLNKDDANLVMEYYPFETLHELYVYGNLNKKSWEKIFSKLLSILTDFQKHRKKISKNEYLETLHQMYYVKTKTRMEKLKKNDLFNIFFNNSFYINGVKFKCLRSIINDVEKIFNKIFFSNLNSEFTIIHGDFFFSNILFDERTGKVKLIDPRGSFGKEIIFGDLRYDLAKLFHSVNGKYDLIVENEFSINIDNLNIKYNFFTNKNRLACYNVINNYLESRGDFYSILFVEATLFLSMIPLHKGSFEKQILMMCRGVELLKELERKIKNDKKE